MRPPWQARTTWRSDTAMPCRDRGCHSGPTGRSDQIEAVTGLWRDEQLSTDVDEAIAGKLVGRPSSGDGRAATAVQPSALAAAISRQQMLRMLQMKARGLCSHHFVIRLGHDHAGHVMVTGVGEPRICNDPVSDRNRFRIAASRHGPERGLEDHTPREQHQQEVASTAIHCCIRRRA